MKSNFLLILAITLFVSVAVAKCENGRCQPTLAPLQPVSSSVRRIERSVLIGGPRYRTRRSYFVPRQFRQRFYSNRRCH